LSGNTISLHGLWVYRLALAWLAWQLTESEFWVGTIAFTQYFPIVLFGPLFGVLADRFDRRAALLFIHSISMVTMLLLTMLTAFGKVDIYLLCVLSLMQGISDSALTPIRLALIPNLVNRQQLQSAVALNSVSFNVSRFIGPAIAGVIIAFSSVTLAFAFNAVTYIAVLAAVFMVKLMPAEERAPRQGDVWAEMKEGIHYAVTHTTIRMLLTVLAISAILARGPLELLPAFADHIFNRGSGGLAILTSAAGGGAVIAGLLLSQRMRRLRLETVTTTVAAVGVLIILLGLTKEFWLAVAIVTLLGFALSLAGVGSQILLQNAADDQYRGRVSSFWGLITFGGTALGGLIVGGISSMWGLSATTVCSGILCILLALMVLARRASADPPASASV
jgi:MFS family permease